jgi:hypothetical protein
MIHKETVISQISVVSNLLSATIEPGLCVMQQETTLIYFPSSIRRLRNWLLLPSRP